MDGDPKAEDGEEGGVVHPCTYEKQKNPINNNTLKCHTGKEKAGWGINGKGGCWRGHVEEEDDEEDQKAEVEDEDEGEETCGSWGGCVPKEKNIKSFTTTT
jgi:hypothetical protein